MAETSREAAQWLDELAWAVKPANYMLANLAAHLCQYADESLGPTAIRCRFDFPPTLPPHVLSAEVRHGLFMVVKEALNNVV